MGITENRLVMTNNANFNGLKGLPGLVVWGIKKNSEAEYGFIRKACHEGYWLWAEEVRGAVCMTYIFYPENS